METGRNWLELESHSQFATDQNLLPFWRSIQSISKSLWRSFSIFLICPVLRKTKQEMTSWQEQSVHTKIMKGESMKGVDRCCPRGDALEFYCSFEVFALKTQMNVPDTGDLYCLHFLNVFWPSKWSKNWAEHKTQCRLWNPGQVLLQLLLQALLCLCCEKQRKANSCGE